MLKDLKVIELAGVLAGPAVGMFFAEMGATVIKIENNTTGGDASRKWKLPVEDKTLPGSAYFASVNWGKEHIFMDLTLAHDHNQLIELIKTADVLICNWKKGDARKFGLDHDAIKKINSRIIYGNITGFGDDDRVAYDVVLQAETGWMFMNGSVDSPPVKIPVAIIDLFAAHQLKEGILVALINRMKTGEGAVVYVSLFDAAIAALANQASNYLITGHIPQRMGSLHPNIAPYGEIIKCLDGKEIVLAIATDKQFAAFCGLIGCDDLIKDENFITNTQRVKNRELLFRKIEEKTQLLNSSELMQHFISNNIPAGVIRNMEELFQQKRSVELILEDEVGKRVRTAVFNITTL
ncbi:MAG: CaiB/BaiF CoA transferase family protein [Chitinophagales bacterium]